MSFVRFTDDQLIEICRLVKTLAPQCRDEFLQRLAQALQGREDVGDGDLFRIARDIIKTNHLFAAPSAFETSPRGRRRASG
jgi:hypothetical protein